MESSDVAITQPIEYIDTICLDKNAILTDGCATGTLTTVDGDSLPVTFIVSQHLPENSESESIKEISDVACDLMEDNQEECLKEESSNDEPKTVYTVNFPSNNKPDSDCMEILENALISEEKSAVSEIPVDNVFDSTNNDLNAVTRLEDFMDVVTTYKCKFCRFSCPWKSGLVSHIRCCHIAERRNAAQKTDKEPNIVTATKKVSEPVTKPIAKSEPVSETVLSEASKEMEEDFNDDSSKLSKSPESEAESETSSKGGAPILERHIFLCGQCSDGFMTLEDCKQHMIDDHNIRLDQSMIKPLKKRGRPRTRPIEDPNLECDSTMEFEETVKESKRSSRPPKNLDDDYEFGHKKARKDCIGEKIFRCTHNGCGHRFTEESHLHYHYSCHASSGKSFICPECVEAPIYEHWRGIVMHLWKEHTMDIGLHSCNECNYKTYSYFKLNNHRKIHSEERAYLCQTCGKGFKQISQLRNHVVIHLDRKNLPEKRWYSEQECTTCGRKFSDTKCLRKHQQAVHSKLKPFVCSFCGHLSARKAMLELHMRQHTGEKPFVCEHCDYRTGDHNSLRRHRMRHTGAKPYKCPHCAYACIQAISYKTHLKNKHPGMDGLFSCSMCSFKSVSKENYMNHMADHKRESETLTEAATSALESESDALLQELEGEQPAQMQLNDNALQQLEGILPGNLTAAQLIYSCLNALSREGGTVSLPPGVTVNIPPGTASTADGTQTITIQLSSSQEVENEPYYFTIQQDGSTTSFVLPSDQAENSITESADIDNVNFTEQDVPATILDCSVLHEGENSEVANSDSFVITYGESFDDPETFTAAVIADSPNQDSQ